MEKIYPPEWLSSAWQKSNSNESYKMVERFAVSIATFYDSAKQTTHLVLSIIDTLMNEFK